MQIPTLGRSVYKIFSVTYFMWSSLAWFDKTIGSTYLKLYWVVQDKNMCISESIGKQLGHWYWLQASFYFVCSFYLLVVTVSVLTEVCLLMCCSYPWLRLLVPERFVLKPGVSGLMVLQLLARLLWPRMRPWTLSLRGRRPVVVLLAGGTASLLATIELMPCVELLNY
jgi:hypothetical protein